MAQQNALSKALITVLLLIIIALLLYIAVQPKTIVTTPQEQTQPTVQEPEQKTETPTPRAPEPDRGEPTPRAPEPVEPGTPAIQPPNEALFWVNDIRVPSTTDYGYFIPVQDDDVKTFAGSIGPYFEDPTENIHIELCAEFYKVQAAPACERVPVIYRDNYISFAKGYQFDEYIGGMAAKDYLAYYTMYAGTKPIAHSNKAVIRTVKG